MFRFLLPILLGVSVIEARALTVRPPSFSELVTAAESIVVGEITAVDCVLENFSGRTVPFTYVTVNVAETIKGTAERKIVLRCLGGTSGGETLHIVGAPQFTVGLSGFFFIHNNGTQFCPLVGINHGCYWNVRDEPSGATIVTRDDGRPLRSTSEIQSPLQHAPHPERSRAATGGGALTPARFAAEIKAEVARAPR